MTKQELSILIPTYNCDCTALVRELCRQADGVAGLSYEIIVADDGSTDRTWVDRCRQVESLPHCRFIDCGINRGRAAIRNYLAREAQYAWLLFLDSDMTIFNPQFVASYANCDGQVVYGGYVVGDGNPSNLRYLYEKKCEPEHRPDERRKRPFQHFHTSNFMVSRDTMLAHPFDERFRNYGYEDVFFGKELKQAGFTITHIDNPAGFFTYEDNPNFVSKTEEGLRTLHQFRDDLRGYSQLLTFVDNIHVGAVKFLIRLWHRLFKSLERRNLCGNRPNLTIFKLYKVGYFLSIH
ncbi:MAG: glycosyltransferase [Prevotella sp.]|nr:glycosyltransferase [Prevotella sp.]